jgi:hypothetical protein
MPQEVARLRAAIHVRPTWSGHLLRRPCGPRQVPREARREALSVATRRHGMRRARRSELLRSGSCLRAGHLRFLPIPRVPRGLLRGTVLLSALPDDRPGSRNRRRTVPLYAAQCPLHAKEAEHASPACVRRVRSAPPSRRPANATARRRNCGKYSYRQRGGTALAPTSVPRAVQRRKGTRTNHVAVQSLHAEEPR